MNANRFKVSTAVFLAATISAPAEAYVGPGAGLGAVGTVIALFGAILLGIVGFIWYPIKRLLNRNKSAHPETADSDALENGEKSLEVESDPQD
jgi:hypothetical protein